jgi:tRNA threonylcarbamoyl adenosine modification protein YeaZ
MISVGKKPVLAIDTSQSLAGVAVFADGALLASAVAPAGSPVSESLSDTVRETLRKAGIAIGEISEIIVSNGPGSATGLRIGIAFGRGLADSLGVPSREVSLLERMQRRADGERALAAVYVGSDKAAVFDPAGRLPNTRTLAEFADSIDDYRAIIVTSDLCARFSDELRARIASTLTVVGNGALWIGD